ncbi:OmpA family protein [Oscillatoriales cyanobacterium LEGE 11467]|uniref:OmpA family protein n=2 Tax=Zarconia TaxID=2992130 RepID=A0A928VXU1_9CYAN|nr:OmpA family protein [Zarconia navalis LEGE 11467]
MQLRLSQLESHIERLESKIYEPTDLVDPLLPLINELLTQQVKETQAGICEMLVPIIDRVLLEKSKQDLESLSEALADVIPMAISQEIKNSPEQVANAIAPEVASAIRKQIHLDRDAIKDALGSEMGRAIKAQIELERDAMVDALYPVIGATISKYMGEAVREINAKVENALSIQGVERKIRAKVQGVSEAELILRESMPCIVEAIFLIHKASGLIVAEVQNVSGEKLESEMIAGMLTAIRSFANDCVTRDGNTSELNEIEYSGSKIVLEVAGYCYLAISIKGEPSKSFIAQMRQTLGTIVRKYDRQLEEFEGDPDSVPEPIYQHLEILMHTAERENEQKGSPSRPTTILVLGALLLLGTTILGGWRLYGRHIERRALSALSSTPELAVYRLHARVRGGRVQLSGKLPDEFSRALAERVAGEELPRWEIDNSILAANVLPNPTVVEAEVRRTVGFFNDIEGVDIWADYIDNQVRVRGTLERMTQAEQLTQALDRIPGVDSVVSTFELQGQSEILTTRIYFDKGAAYPTETEAAKIVPIGQMLEQNGGLKLKIIGHSDITGDRNANLSLAEQRAIVLKNRLIDLGIEPERLITEASIQPPPDVSDPQALALSRCVRFEPIQTADGQTLGNNGNDI